MSTETEPFYDISEGDWRVVASPLGDGDATIEFTYKCEPFRTVTYPAYKVWNIPAHLRDIIEDFEHGMALASWTGFGSVLR